MKNVNEIKYEIYQKEFNNLPAELQISSLNPKFCKEFQVYNRNLKIIYWRHKEKKNIFLNCFFLGKIKGTKYFDIQSPYPYGGPISSTNDKEFINKANNIFEAWAKKKNIIVEIYKFNPLLNQENWYNGFVIKNRKTVSIDLKKNLLEGYEKRRFYDIKNIEKKNILKITKLSSRSSNDLFLKIYKENMKKIAADKFYFFSDQYISNILSLNIINLWYATVNNNIVSAALILNSKKSKTIEYFLGARDFNFDKYKSTSFLIHKISMYYKKCGYKKFYLGGGRTQKEDDSLLFFKKGFSDTALDFLIGYKIYDSNIYNRLRKKFDNQEIKKILFYR
jgi:hypothetical protein